MDRTPLHDIAEQAAQESGFILGPEIYRGVYYTADKVRSLIFKGSYKDKAAILKIYDDPRLSDEPQSNIAFNKHNRSTILRGPEVYEYKIISPKSGWLIREHLEDGSFLPQPVEDKKAFAELFYEYRSNFPKTPTRDLMLAENLAAPDFHILRINRWLELANAKESENILQGEVPFIRPEEFVPRYGKAMDLIRAEFSSREMIWCQGHFKSDQLFKLNDGTYCLTDFAHSHVYPEGYELAFIIWADWIMSADWQMPYTEWRQGIDTWLEILKPIAEKLDIKNYDNLMQASLVERIIGTILADVGASDKARLEKEQRIQYLYRLFDEIVK